MDWSSCTHGLLEKYRSGLQSKEWSFETQLKRQEEAGKSLAFNLFFPFSHPLALWIGSRCCHNASFCLGYVYQLLLPKMKLVYIFPDQSLGWGQGTLLVKCVVRFHYYRKMYTFSMLDQETTFSRKYSNTIWNRWISDLVIMTFGSTYTNVYNLYLQYILSTFH